MQIIENSKIKEKVYIEKLTNGITVMVIPRKVQKKYIIWATGYGSVDNKFLVSSDKDITEVPDGIAHYLEHKLFEQENGKNSLDVLCSLGVDANAYTTNDHTAYLYECTENFDEALDEFMNYMQNPYFTDENVEKERGIIEQEIMMYDDYPEWSIYMNAMKCMYKDNEINIDVAGTKETISKITKEKLYEVYDAFYYPSNMVLVVCGDFEPNEIIRKIDVRTTLEYTEDVNRVYNEEQENIVEKYKEKQMNISMPIALVGYKDNDLKTNKVRKNIAVDIISTILFGKSSEMYKELYESGKLISEPSVIYEFSKTFSHLLIQFQSNYIEDVLKVISEKIEYAKKRGISKQDYERAKKKVYGELIKEYNDVSTIATAIVSDYFRDINSFDYFEDFNTVTKEYVEKVLRELFDDNKKVLSVIKPLEE